MEADAFLSANHSVVILLKHLRNIFDQDIE